MSHHPKSFIAPSDAWRLLKGRLTDERMARMEKVASQRTRHLRLVLQDVHDPHNISACMRSAEAFGIQDIDVVTLLHQRFRPSTAARGVEGWLTVRRHNSFESCLESLKKSGYKLAAGVPAASGIPLQELPTQDKLAIIFGNEHAGIDDRWHSHLDYRFTIPMVGMVESLNISVSAAVTLQNLTQAARHTTPPSDYFLSDAEREQLLCEWICYQVPSWEGELARLRER